MSSTEDIIGRQHVNDLDEILAVTNTDVDATIHAVQDNADAIFTWDYTKGARPALEKLYEKAKTSQWNGETDLDWSIEVDQEAVVAANAIANGRGNVDFSGTVHGQVGRRRVDRVRRASPRTGCSASSCTASRAR